MFKIDRAANAIVPMRVCSFSELGFRERNHLQEWIANHPAALGEDLLVIQKEFSGFSDTNERLDLLALDKRGSLVIIENKLDDAGKDVTWQALKYASYCSSLSRENIRAIYQDYLARTEPGANAEERLCEFLEIDDFQEASLNKGVTQRVVLVAARFRKEVTSTVLWLSSFGIRLQCFKATPYAMGDDLFLGIDQVMPTPDVEEFRIGIAEKAREEAGTADAEIARYAMRREFWAKLLAAMALRSELFRNIAPLPQNWISAGSGSRGIAFNFGVTKRGCRVELYVDRGDQEGNEAIFDVLAGHRDAVERAFGRPLEWERLEGKQACRVRSPVPGNVFDRETWPALIADMTDAMVRFETAMQGPLEDVRRHLKGRG